MGGVNHNCGFVVAHTLHDAYSFLDSLQHRGREITGFGFIGDNRIDAIKWRGTVKRFSITDLYNIFPSHNYHTYFGHVRYATRGEKDLESILRDGHPHVIGGTVHNQGDHVIVLDCDAAIVHNGHVLDDYFKDIDTSGLKTSCDSEALLHYFIQKGEHELMKNIPCSYSGAIADKRRKDVVVLRDKKGMKPGILGWKDGKHVAASEDIAIIKNGGEIIEDLEPGSAYYLSPDGDFSKQIIVDPKLAWCFFERNYISNYASTVDGTSNKRVRECLGEELACEYVSTADYVTYVPRCPKSAARAYAKIAEKEFIDIFYKPRDERAFMGSTLEERAKSISSNLFPLPAIIEMLRGKKIDVLDDSIIRGNNSKWAMHLLYDVIGVKEATLLSYTPPIGPIGKDGVPRGCKSGGVDMPPDDKFIIRTSGKKPRNRTYDEVSKEMGMPVYYLSVKGMLNAFEKAGISKNNLCTYCIGGLDAFG